MTRFTFRRDNERTVRKKIGECLVEAGLITTEDLACALAVHEQTGEWLGSVLVRLHLATEEEIAKTLAFQLGFPYIDFSGHALDPFVVGLIAKNVSLEGVCIAVGHDGNVLTVAMADPLLFSLVQDLESQTGCRITQVVATRAGIIDALETAYPEATISERPPVSREDANDSREGLDERSTPTSVAHLADAILERATRSHASDIHIEPAGKGVRIRQRLDGVLTEVMARPDWDHEALAARLKSMAGMDVEEKRLPQDGRLRVSAGDGTHVDFRASTLRTLAGEKVVLRVFDRPKPVPPLEELGFSPASLAALRDLLHRQHGMILVAGPPGSGKTTTAWAAVISLQSEKVNIVTVEDPVEYQMPGINQIQITDTWTSAVRSIQQQDPDLVLVGDLRDRETTMIAMQAAQRHLVVSTSPGGDAASTVLHLTQMGAEARTIVSTLAGIVVQRLVRRLCTNCRQKYVPPPDMRRLLDISDAEAESISFYRAAGCDQCSYTGYRGRVGIFEVLTVTDDVRRAITEASSEEQLREPALASASSRLGEDGLRKVKSGVTTLDELLRVGTDIGRTRTLCAACGCAMEVDFAACPDCGARPSGGCPTCGRALQRGWSFCPYCASPTRRARHLRSG